MIPYKSCLYRGVSNVPTEGEDGMSELLREKGDALEEFRCGYGDLIALATG